MDMRHTERTQVKRPVAPPIDLDAGRLDVGRAGLAGGFVLAALLLATVGLWAVKLSWDTYTPNKLGIGVGLSVAAVALLFGGVVLYVSVTEWLDHRQRVQDWHIVALNAYEQLDATETIEQVNEWAFNVDNPAHVLVAALWVSQRIREGESMPYATRKLDGPIFLAGRRVGDIGKLTAERMGQKFENLGLIVGRAERRAGEWVPQSDDELVRLVLGRWR